MWGIEFLIAYNPSKTTKYYNIYFYLNLSWTELNQKKGYLFYSGYIKEVFHYNILR